MIIRCRANYRRRETISREWGDYATPGPTTYELTNSLSLLPGSPREMDALETRPCMWDESVVGIFGLVCGLSDFVVIDRLTHIL